MANTVWCADTLKLEYPEVKGELEQILSRHNIEYREIPGTRDIWCRDYMPVQAADGSLVQFVYRPQYLSEPGDIQYITPPTCYRNLDFARNVRESVIVLDGGGIEVSGRTGICTQRIFRDNPWYARNDLEHKLRVTLALEKLIVLPEEPHDATGHIDGMVRFVDEKRVVVNDYGKVAGLESFGRKIRKILQQSGLKVILFPYAPRHSFGKVSKRKILPATGYYINFLRIGNIIILPSFGIAEDENAFAICCQVFENCLIATVGCSSLARKGGVLNCVSWII